MMDVFDSPLNSAHQQQRQADRLLAAAKYEQSIACHQKAADLLDKAMSSTKVKEALNSLQLQKQYHIEQQNIVRMKQKEAEIKAKRSAQIAQLKTEEEELEYARRNSFEYTDLYNEVIGRIEETDCLLTELDHRKEGKYNLDESESTLNVSGAKVPKDDKQIIEELRTHNEALRQHMLDLLKDYETQGRDLDHYKSENEKLRDRVKELEKQSKLEMAESTDSDLEFPMHIRMNLDDLTALELPPLGMPKFDNV